MAQLTAKGSSSRRNVMLEDTSGPFRCFCCGYEYPKQRTHFPSVQSRIYAANNHYVPWCYNCINNMFDKYINAGVPEDEAIRRLCARFDVYWNRRAYETMPALGPKTAQSRIKQYITKANQTMYSGKTYDDTLHEEMLAQKAAEEQAAEEAAQAAEEAARIAEEEAKAAAEALIFDDTEVMREDDEREVTAEHIRFWGRGKDRLAYLSLQDRYDELSKEYSVDTAAAKILLKQACLSEYEIDCLQREGKPFEKQQASLVNTLGSLNLKPSQIKEAEKNSGLDDMAFGVGVKHWETTRPIPEASPEWQDVDDIIKYVLTWYTGGSCQMFGVENEYSDMFKNAIDEYKVERPNTDNFDDVDVISHILTGGGTDG